MGAALLEIAVQPDCLPDTDAAGHLPPADAILERPKPNTNIEQSGIRKMLFRNIDIWGPLATQYLNDLGKYDAIGFMETHADADDTVDLLRKWTTRGYKAAASPSRPTSTARKAGGTVMGVRNGHQVASFRHLAALEEQTIGASSTFAFTPGPGFYSPFMAP